MAALEVVSMAAAAQILPSTNPRPRGENRRRCRRRGADSTRQEWRAGGLLWLASPRFPSPISCSFCPQQLSKNGGQSMCSSPLPFCWRASPRRPSPRRWRHASRQGLGTLLSWAQRQNRCWAPLPSPFALLYGEWPNMTTWQAGFSANS